MDTFTITAYSAATGTATLNVTVGGQTYTNFRLKGIPIDTVANVKAYIRAYADAYAAGKAQEAAAVVSPSAEVAALLNVPTGF